MNFVEVLVGTAQYHGQAALTYSTSERLPVGSIVGVPLRSQIVLGIVSRNVSKPRFPTKPITTSFPLHSLPRISLDLLDWLQIYYPAPLGSTVQLFLPKSLSNKHTDYNNPPPLLTPSEQPPLSLEQQKALSTINTAGLYLLHGETGSGKTRIYVELAMRALKEGRSAIILTPEIGLTSQLAHTFQEVFGDRTILFHSQLTETARKKAWIQALQSNQPLVVIGPRSALFSPLRNIGVIVVDEAHESAYKQEQAPHYHASRVAAKLGQLSGCPVVLGSATPLVTDYFLAEQKNRPIIRMQQLAKGDQEQSIAIEVIDLKDRTGFKRHSFLSDSLLQSIETTLLKKEQALLFLNRRGTARIVFCDRCGWQATCPHCDTPIVYHGDTHVMRCHTCGYNAPAVTRCPECHNTSVVFKSIGTKAIVEEVVKIFPQARVQRFDMDNKKAERIEGHYENIKAGEVDILVGTQMLAKGLDLPQLGLVGVILADTSLYIPDYTAQERTYQLLIQVLGRIGRGHRSSKAVIQTYSPDSPLLAAVLQKDWQTFYHKELAERKAFLFPPYCYLLKLSCRRASQTTAQKAAEAFANQLKQQGHKVLIEGPAPSFRQKISGKYEWQLIVKAKQRGEIVAIIQELPANWLYDIDPINLL